MSGTIIYITIKFDYVRVHVLRTPIYFHVNIKLDFPITYRNASVQSECACLHKTVNMVVLFVKSNENTYPKGRALM